VNGPAGLVKAAFLEVLGRTALQDGLEFGLDDCDGSYSKELKPGGRGGFVAPMSLTESSSAPAARPSRVFTR